MTLLFEAEKEETKEIYGSILYFVSTYNNEIETTEYYSLIPNKTFLQAIKETLISSTLEENQKTEFITLLKTFLENLKDIYTKLLSLPDDPEALEMICDLRNSAENFGFTGGGVSLIPLNIRDDKLFSELETFVNSIDKKGD